MSKPKEKISIKYFTWLINDWIGTGHTAEDLAEEIVSVCGKDAANEAGVESTAEARSFLRGYYKSHQ